MSKPENLLMILAFSFVCVDISVEDGFLIEMLSFSHENNNMEITIIEYGFMP